MSGPESFKWADLCTAQPSWREYSPQQLAYGALCAQASSLALFGSREAMLNAAANANSVSRSPLRHLTGIPKGNALLARVLHRVK